MKIIYGTPTCSKCQSLKRELDTKKEKYKYIDISKWPADLIKNLVEKYKTTALPIIGEEDVETTDEKTN